MPVFRLDVGMIDVGMKFKKGRPSAGDAIMAVDSHLCCHAERFPGPMPAPRKRRFSRALQLARCILSYLMAGNPFIGLEAVFSLAWNHQR